MSQIQTLLGHKRVDLLKMGIKGFERPVLSESCGRMASAHRHSRSHYSVASANAFRNPLPDARAGLDARLAVQLQVAHRHDAPSVAFVTEDRLRHGAPCENARVCSLC